jgi:hypothetical protein
MPAGVLEEAIFTGFLSSSVLTVMSQQHWWSGRAFTEANLSNSAAPSKGSVCSGEYVSCRGVAIGEAQACPATWHGDLPPAKQAEHATLKNLEGADNCTVVHQKTPRQDL